MLNYEFVFEFKFEVLLFIGFIGVLVDHVMDKQPYTLPSL